MARLHRTRRIRNERWYSNWDLLSIAYSSKEHRGTLGASRRSPKTRRWQVENRIVWLYPLGVRRSGINPFAGVGLVALLALPLHMLGQPWQGRALVAMQLAQLATFGLFIYFAFIRMNPLLAPIRRERCRFLEAHPPPEWAALATELETRRKWWRLPTVRFSSDSPLFTLWKFDPTSFRLAAIAAACVLAPSTLMITAGRPFPGIFPIDVICGLTAIALGSCLLGRLSFLCTRTNRALSARQCPDCSYMLAGIPNAIDPALLNGLHTGPARCPECGTHWPLVPPPIPGR